MVLTVFACLMARDFMPNMRDPVAAPTYTHQMPAPGSPRLPSPIPVPAHPYSIPPPVLDVPRIPSSHPPASLASQIIDYRLWLYHQIIGASFVVPRMFSDRIYSCLLICVSVSLYQLCPDISTTPFPYTYSSPPFPLPIRSFYHTLLILSTKYVRSIDNSVLPQSIPTVSYAPPVFPMHFSALVFCPTVCIPYRIWSIPNTYLSVIDFLHSPQTFYRLHLSSLCETVLYAPFIRITDPCRLFHFILL